MINRRKLSTIRGSVQLSPQLWGIVSIDFTPLQSRLSTCPDYVWTSGIALLMACLESAPQNEPNKVVMAREGFEGQIAERLVRGCHFARLQFMSTPSSKQELVLG
ncbi:hypothetical protein J6590_003568 [Homalodisca vitripennis]|nr:hypothetical protein J6590_003568 [Homalodisca vitripennis]